MLFVKPTSDHRESPSSISDELTIARRLRGDTDGEPHIGSGVLRRPADLQEDILSQKLSVRSGQAMVTPPARHSDV